MAALGCGAALAIGLLLASSETIIRLHQSARSIPAGTVLTTALACALFFSPGRLARVAAVLLLLLGVSAFAAGSIPLLDRFGRDPFLVPAEPLVRKSVSGLPVLEFPVPFPASELRLSPGGRNVALVSDEAREDEARTFHVGPPGGALTALVAADLLFLSDTHVLVLKADGTAAELSLASIATPDVPQWTQQVTGLYATHLAARAEGWSLFGWDSAGRVVRAEGDVAGGAVRLTRWPALESGGWPEIVAASDSEALVVEMHEQAGPFRRFLHRWPVLRTLGAPQRETRWWRLGPDGPAVLAVSELAVDCCDGGLDEGAVVCAAFDGTRTRFAAVERVTGRVAPIGGLSGRFLSYGRAAPGWLSGWSHATAVAVRLSTREAFHLDGEAADNVLMIAAADRMLGALSTAGATSTVRLFPMPE